MHLTASHKHDFWHDDSESGAGGRRGLAFHEHSADDLLDKYEDSELDGGQNPQDVHGDLKEAEARSEANDQQA